MHNGNSRKTSILFFGRKKCRGSREILDRLESLGFDVTCILSGHRFEKMDEDVTWWEGDYIISFRSLFILPDSLLKRARIAAINFHPAPPEYPGSGCVNFALYDDVGEYGVTAHIMNRLVDNGTILEVRRFPVNRTDKLPSVLERSHSELLGLCLDFVIGIKTKGEAFIKERQQHASGERWSGKARRIRDLDALQKIDTGMEKDELERIIRATNIPGYPPYIDLHGYRFVLDDEK
ncbi:phosphoribosylglycinamide formyltransferase-1 [Rhodovulum imhoffii]|uniref:Phosphoribosylglycinamide formyltransferase-1 n=2 Tax=Rhodovulum imhoffii TaxID=365340 RepID=A0A2T5BJ88_9RHOB|nr:phosphoribosylglycinamide formyltransferase-1 [Rhodovulum imhoffii]